jgi:hypothetical protein
MSVALSEVCDTVNEKYSRQNTGVQAHYSISMNYFKFKLQLKFRN